MSETVARVLLADVGGTNVRFGLADPAQPRPLLAGSVRRYRAADFATFADAARTYLGESGAAPRRGVFALAGQIRGGVVQVTNHAWSVSSERVRAELALESVHFINDFAAMSLCVPLLAPADVRRVGDAPAPALDESRDRTFAVVGPGTGLGVGALLLRGGRASALETEGGHIGFAPRNEEEVEVLRRLQARYGRVSNERLLSGSGLSNLHEALGEIHGTFAGRLGPAEITQRANERGDASCVHAVEVFCELLGAVAGDFVLAFGAWDGVYLAGGMPPLLLPWLDRGGFRRRFEDKGRFAEQLAQVPTQVIVHPDAGLLGAAACARALAGAGAAA
jgi:glucokinase